MWGTGRASERVLWLTLPRLAEHWFNTVSLRSDTVDRDNLCPIGELVDIVAWFVLLVFRCICRGEKHGVKSFDRYEWLPKVQRDRSVPTIGKRVEIAVTE